MSNHNIVDNKIAEKICTKAGETERSGAVTRHSGRVAFLSRSAVEFFVEVISARNHKDNHIAADNFISNPIGCAAGLKSINKKTAEGAMERFAVAGIVTQTREAIFSFFLNRPGEPLPIFFGGRGEKDFRHNLATRENLFKSSQFAGFQEFSSRPGSSLYFLHDRGMPKDILAQEFPNFLNFPLNFLNPVFSRGSHINYILK